jgi:DNA-binding NtrC family response regulator
MPALIDRKEDIGPLSERIVDELNLKYNLQKSIEPKTVDLFSEYSWPGNVRQLRNIVERIYVTQVGDHIEIDSAKILYEDDDIYEDRTPHQECTREKLGIKGDGHLAMPLKEYMHRIEEAYINNILSECNGSVADAAKKLGIHRTALYKKLND